MALTQARTLQGAIIAPKRLAAVYASGLLDTLPEESFDNLTRLASLITRAPYSFATIVDEQRSFWKSSHGLPAGSPRQNTVAESFCQYVIDAEQEVIIPDAKRDARTRNNPSIALMGVRAWAGFPITSPDGAVLGSFCVVDVVPRTWAADDIEALRILADCASREISLRNIAAQEHEARLRSEALAHTLQGSLLPPSLPSFPGLDVAACYKPAGRGVDVVGDFYDIFQSRENECSFIVGDVCGKGVEAAKMAALARYSVRSFALAGNDPAKIMTELNTVIRANNTENGTFLTAVYGTISLGSHGNVVHLACGGHRPPTLRRADGRVEMLPVEGKLIGVFEHYEIHELTIPLGMGESLIIFTDGVNEARVGKNFIEEEAITAVIQNAGPGAADIAEALRDMVLDFCGGVASDDIAVLVISSQR